MMNSVSTFKEAVAMTVANLGLNESNWKAEGWKELWSKLDQSVLNDAFEQHGNVRTIFSDLGKIDARNCKAIERVQKKMTEQYSGKVNYFKVVSDFVAVRIPCKVVEIQDKIDRLKDTVLRNKGVVHIRGASDESPYGSCISPEKKHVDILQYVYVFLEKIGYPIEFQIGHSFAAHTFTIDSALRDNPSCGKVDLWKNDFYVNVKKYLLNQANNETTESREALIAQAEQLHSGNIPEDLRSILNDL